MYQTTFILKRRTSPGLSKKNRQPKPLKAKHYVYDLVENTNVIREPDLKLILNSYVEGNGVQSCKVLLESVFSISI